MLLLFVHSLNTFIVVELRDVYNILLGNDAQTNSDKDIVYLCLVKQFMFLSHSGLKMLSNASEQS